MLILSLFLIFPLQAIALGEASTPVLAYITNANIAYLLLLIGIYGVFFELTNPGLIIPAITGIISLTLVVYAFLILPVDYFGLMLIFLGLGFMITEVYVTSYGIIGLFGIIAFILGSVLLFDIHDPHYHTSIPLILIMSIISFIFVFAVLSPTIKLRKRKEKTSKKRLIGCDGVVLSVINEQILVRVLGETWHASSTEKLKPGDKIHVVQNQGLILFVKLQRDRRPTPI